MSPDLSRKRVGILISGRGSNMSALVAASRDPRFPAEIVGVISNRTDAEGLAAAAAAGLPTATITTAGTGSPEAADKAIDAQLKLWNVDLVCLAGFMRILTPWFTSTWDGRLLNIHPSLLPDYKGLETHARVLADGETRHGCTVHFVTSDLDAGPVIAQVQVPVDYGDTPKTLGERVLKAEHRLYPMALALVARGEVSAAG